MYDRFNANRLTINKLTPRKQILFSLGQDKKRLLIIRHVSEFRIIALMDLCFLSAALPRI